MKGVINRVRNKIIWKIFLIFWITTLIVISMNIFITTEIVLGEAKIDRLKERMSELAEEAVLEYEQGDTQELKAWYRRIKERHDLRVVLINENGKPLGLPPKWQRLMQNENDSVFEKRRPLNHILRVVDQQITSSSGANYRLKLLPSRAIETHFGPPAMLHSTRIGLTFFVLLIASWWLARSIAKPVNALEKASQEIAKGNFSVRVQESVGSRRDELGDLAKAFDEMAGKIAQLIAAQKQLFSDISHDIRTPLTRQKLAIELARESDDPSKMLDKLEQQNQHIEDLLNALLTLFKLEDSTDFHPETVLLSELIEKAIDAAEVEFKTKSITLVKHVEQNLKTYGNDAFLYRAFNNLLSNALRYSPPNATININAEESEKWIKISIQDEGPGIPENELEKVLEPFYRADKSRHSESGGYGIGLAIVSKVANQSGGELVLSNRSPGLCATLKLPKL